MKIGVIADTHLVSGRFGLKKAAVQLISKSRLGVDYLQEVLETHFKGVDRILHAGDLVDGGIIDLLEEIAPVDAVRGNMDSGPITRELPIKKVVTVVGRRIGLIHGWGAPTGIVDRIRKEFDDVEAIVFGHTHSPMNNIVDGIMLFNPGSPIDKRFAPYNSLGIMTVTEHELSGKIIKLDK